MNNVISTTNAPAAIGPYSQAIKSTSDSTVYVSGQLPINPQTSKMSDTIEEQTEQSLLNLKAILEESGSSLKNVVKTTVYLSDMNNFNRMNGVYSKFFDGAFPARVAVEVSCLPKNAKVEIDAIAVC